MDDDLKQNLTAGETWIRGLFILMFVFMLVVARLVTGAVVVRSGGDPVFIHRLYRPGQ
jgi:hypothetical protein